MLTLEVADAADLVEYASWFDDQALSSRIQAPDAQWLEYIKQPHVHALVARDAGGQIVCFSQIDQDDQRQGWFDVIVRPDQQGSGLGTTFLGEIKNWSRGRFTALCGAVEPDNHRALALAHTAGFQLVAERDQDGFKSFRLALE